MLVLAGLLVGAIWGLGAGPAQGATPSRPGVVLVGFSANTSEAQQRTLERVAGAYAARPLGAAAASTPGGRRLERRLGKVVMLRVAPARVGQALARLRRRRGLIRFAEPDYLMQSSAADVVPNDPSFTAQWGDLNTGQTVNGGNSGTSGADDRAATAWSVGTGSPAVVIAEVDTGVDYTHPDLAANVWSNPGGVGGCSAGTHGYNVIAHTCDPMDDDTSYGGHGTHVAGIIGAVGNNHLGVAGMNWHTTILPVKWLNSTGSGSTDQLITALDWVARAKQAGVNIRVVNDSATFEGTAYSQALSDEIDLARIRRGAPGDRGGQHRRERR